MTIYRVGYQYPNPGTFWYKHSDTRSFLDLESAKEYQKEHPGLDIWVSKNKKRFEKL